MPLDYDSTLGLTAPSRNLADDEKVEAVVTFLTQSHLDAHGGYPLDYLEFRGWVFVADLDDAKERNRTLLSTWKRKTLIRWYDAAVGEICDDFDIIDALYETRPDEDTP